MSISSSGFSSPVIEIVEPPGRFELIADWLRADPTRAKLKIFMFKIIFFTFIKYKNF